MELVLKNEANMETVSDHCLAVTQLGVEWSDSCVFVSLSQSQSAWLRLRIGHTDGFQSKLMMGGNYFGGS